MYNTNPSIVFDAVWILRITDFKIFLQFILQFFCSFSLCKYFFFQIINQFQLKNVVSSHV